VAVTPEARWPGPQFDTGVSDVTVTPGRGAVQVRWTDPYRSMGEPLLGYHVFAVDTRNGRVAGRAIVGADTWSTSIAGLTNGVNYQLWVASVSAGGYGGFGMGVGTPRAYARVATVPAAVPWHLAELFGPYASRVTVRWGSAQDDGGAPVQGFVVVTFADGGVVDWQSLGPGARSTEVAAVVGSGRPVQIYVIAHNAAGLGAFDLARPITVDTLP
jgi:hypothetical protein